MLTPEYTCVTPTAEVSKFSHRIARIVLMLIMSSCSSVEEKALPRAHFEPTKEEMELVLKEMKKEGMFPLCPALPEVQTQLDTIGKHIHTHIALDRREQCLERVLELFEQAVQKNFPHVETSHFEIYLPPIEQGKEGMKYCALSVFMFGHTYTIYLEAKDGHQFRGVLQRPLAVRGEDMAYLMQELMRRDFFRHLQERMDLYLPDSLEKLNAEEVGKKLLTVVEEDRKGFKAINMPLGNPAIVFSPEEEKFIVSILPDRLQGDCLRFFFDPKDLSYSR